jgi:hypothetical protein
LADLRAKKPLQPLKPEQKPGHQNVPAFFASAPLDIA